MRREAETCWTPPLIAEAHRLGFKHTCLFRPSPDIPSLWEFFLLLLFRLPSRLPRSRSKRSRCSDREQSPISPPVNGNHAVAMVFSS